jgi:ribonuclease Z
MHEAPLLPPLAVVKTPYFHLLGYSVAGEETVIQVPELNVVFDIGKCPRPVLTSDFCLLSHGHMDHSAGLAYYLSQRFFQGMTPGTVICPAAIADAVSGVIRSWTALEGKAIEHRVIGLKTGEEYELRKGLIVRTFATRHTVPCAGFLLLDRREKLKPELAEQNLPGHILRDMKARGEKITYTLDVPLIAYTGDTSMGETLLQDGVRDARVLVTECTFFEPGHRKRAAVGQHLHVNEFIEVLPKLENELVLISHLSRRTYLRWAQKTLQKAMEGLTIKPKVEFFMDHAQKLQVRPGKAAPFTPVEPPATADAEDA